MGKLPEKTRLLFAGTSVSGGGAERVFINIINSIDTDRFDVRVILTCAEEKTDIRSDVEVIWYGCTHTRRALWRLRKDIAAFRPDSVFTTHGTLGWSLPLIRLSCRLNFRIFFRVAVTPCENVQTSFADRAVCALNKVFLRKIDLIIAQTDYMRADLIRHYGLKSEKVRTIRNYIDFGRTVSASGAFIPEEIVEGRYNIVAAGALYSVKGFDLLIDAMAEVVRHIPEANLLILGEERYEPGYKDFLGSRITALGLHNNVRLLGHKPNPCPYFKGADLFVMSSRTEGYPNVVLEALSLGTPVVCTDVVDFSGVVDEHNGIVVRKGSAEEIAGGIIKAHNTLKRITFSYRNFDYNTLFQR